MGRRGRPSTVRTLGSGARPRAAEVETPPAAQQTEGTGSGHGRSRTSRRRRRRGRRRADRKPVSLLRELPLLAVVAVVIALLIKTFLVQAFYIPSGSMEHTINVGDRVLVDKLTPWFGSKPERGEVVVFRDPGGWLDHHRSDPPPVVKQIKQVMVFTGLLPSDDEQDLIKRVIGVGGDTVACCDASGRLTVNGLPLDEPYVYPGNLPSAQHFSVTVPAGRLWVMGDHRGDSADSRAHMDQPNGGTIAEGDVIGRAFVVGWPLSRIHRLPVPKTFANKALNAATLPQTPVVIGVVGAVPVVLLRRRVRSRRWAPGASRNGTDPAQCAARAVTGRRTTRRRATQSRRAGRWSHGHKEAPWGKS